MRSIQYEFSSVHIDVPIDLSDEIIEWGKKQISDNSLFKDLKNSFWGREDELHVTILYGIHSKDHQPTFQLLENEKPIHVRLQNVHIFREKLFDVVTISVDSYDLERLNAKLKGNVRYSNRHKLYIPHITIAYVHKGEAENLKDATFNKNKFIVDVAVFSSKDGSRTSLKLKV